MLTDSERQLVADAAGHEYDTANPRWSMTRERFIKWHVRMAEQSARRMSRKGY